MSNVLRTCSAMASESQRHNSSEGAYCRCANAHTVLANSCFLNPSIRLPTCKHAAQQHTFGCGQGGSNRGAGGGEAPTILSEHCLRLVGNSS